MAKPRAAAVDGEPQREFRTESDFAADTDLALVLVDENGVGDRETLAGTAPDFLGREKRIVELLKILVRNPTAIVANADHRLPPVDRCR